MSPLSGIRARLAAVPANLQGMVWMTVGGLFFASFMAIVRHVGLHLDGVQIAFLRYAFGMVFILPFLLRLDRGQLRRTPLGLHLVRGLLHGIGVMCWFYAMTRIPIAEVTAIGFTSPVFAVIGAVIFLGERIRLRRIVAVTAGLGGAVIILQPGAAVIDPGAIAMLVAAPLFAIADLIAKVLTGRESTVAVVAWLSIIVTAVSFGPALYVWQTPGWMDLALMALTAALATLGHLCVIRAFRLAEMSAIMPMRFQQLMWAALIGYLFFAEVPATTTWIGAAIILGSASYIAHREAVARRRSRQGR